MPPFGQGRGVVGADAPGLRLSLLLLLGPPKAATHHKSAMMAAMSELGFMPSVPPSTLAAADGYSKTEDDITQIAFAVKAYLSQNGTAFDAMRGGVGDIPARVWVPVVPGSD